MNGLPYYKAYPRDFIEGTIGMPFEVKCAYRVVLDLIYMQGGNLPDDSRYISGLLGCSVRKWNSIRKTLIDGGKIQTNGKFISNYRAIIELESLRKVQDKQSENRSRPNKNKDLQSPRCDHTESEPDNTVPNGTAPVDFTKEVFDRGVAFLGNYGTPEPRARSLIGKWRKEAGDGETFNALRDANREGVTEPVAWITARLKPSTQPSVGEIMSRINLEGLQ